MRFTLLHPDPARGPGLHPTDLDADVGTPMSRLRPALARVSGYAAWAGAGVRPAVADAVLDDHHVVGQAPLVEGCVLRPSPGPADAAVLAVRADWHVAVVAGPDSAGLLALPDGSTVTLTSSGTDGDQSLLVHDATLPRVLVRRRGDRVHVRAGRSLRWHRWRPDRPRTFGATTVVVRTSRAQPATGGDVREPVARATTWLTPLVGSVALAAALRQPVLLLAGLAAPLVGLGSVVVGRWRRRSAARDEHRLADPAALVAATARASVQPAAPAAVDQPWDPGGSLAVVGPRELALPVARAVVLGALGTHLTGALAVRSERPTDWDWCVWATEPGAPLPNGQADALVVADGARQAAALAAWRASAPSSQRLLVIVPAAGAVPAWCAARLDVGPRSLRLHDATGQRVDRPRHALTAGRATAQARAAAAVRAGAGAQDTAELPPRASLAALAGIPAPDEVTSAWERPPGGLVAALGVGPGGRTVSVDLVADGPHVLVAGTTGAGKSELLTTLVLALALRHPPDRLAMLLVDFKGGTGLGPVAGLPHVLEHVTDLDAPHTRRILAALRAELRRREALLAAAGARDLRDLDPTDPATPPRLLVVVDELRALTEDLPDSSAALTRIAAQGRALGVHLVLATQRPAGAVGADLRANVSLRVALRVTDPADSTDVLDAPDAAQIEAATPGRAWVRRGSRPLEPVQVARAVAEPSAAVVRPARPWSGTDRGWSPDAGTVAPATDLGEAWVRAAVGAARGRPASAPWVPALPPVVTVADVPAGPGLALAVSDLPDEQRRGGVRWDPADGPLLVLGGPRSGRTTALVTAGLAALADGRAVHTVGLPSDAVDRLRADDHGGRVGSTLHTDDARAVARLLELLTAPPGEPSLLLVDRVDLALESLSRMARGAGAERLTALWRARPPGLALACGSDVGAGVLPHLAAFAHRLVLPTPDAALDALAGVPAALAGRRAFPGRAVHLHGGAAELCQVVLPAPVTGPPPTTRPSGLVLVRALPDHADRPRAPATTPSGPSAPSAPSVPSTEGARGLEVTLGVGGDGAEPVRADLAAGLLVVGPPGSGRSTALMTLADALVAAGARVERLVDPALGAAWTVPGVRDVGPADVGRSLSRAHVLLVDDLDEVERDHPGVGDLLAAGDGGGPGRRGDVGVGDPVVPGGGPGTAAAAPASRPRPPRPGVRRAGGPFGPPGPSTHVGVRPGGASWCRGARPSSCRSTRLLLGPSTAARDRDDRRQQQADAHQHGDGGDQERPRGRARAEPPEGQDHQQDLPHDHRRARPPTAAPQPARGEQEEQPHAQTERREEQGRGGQGGGAAQDVDRPRDPQTDEGRGLQDDEQADDEEQGGAAVGHTAEPRHRARACGATRADLQGRADPHYHDLEVPCATT